MASQVKSPSNDTIICISPRLFDSGDSREGWVEDPQKLSVGNLSQKAKALLGIKGSSQSIPNLLTTKQIEKLNITPNIVSQHPKTAPKNAQAPLRTETSPQ